MNVFCKTLLASALATATLASALAADPLTVYGTSNVTAQSNDVDGDASTTIDRNDSRYVIKGAFELSRTIKAFYIVKYTTAATAVIDNLINSLEYYFTTSVI